MFSSRIDVIEGCLYGLMPAECAKQNGAPRKQFWQPVRWRCGLQEHRVVSISCGAEHSVVSTAAGEVFAWGWGRYGNVGDGQRQDRCLRIPFPPSSPLLRACMRMSHGLESPCLARNPLEFANPLRFGNFHGSVFSTGCGQHGRLYNAAQLLLQTAHCQCWWPHTTRC